jgi:hypothetical protein
VLFRSTDEGQTWQPISGDLTRNDKSKMASSGGPITKDNTSVEYYGTIFTVDEAARARHDLVRQRRRSRARDEGRRRCVDERDAAAGAEWLQINCIAASPFEDGGCYVAATRYKLDDFRRISTRRAISAPRGARSRAGSTRRGSRAASAPIRSCRDCCIAAPSARSG